MEALIVGLVSLLFILMMIYGVLYAREYHRRKGRF